MNYWTVPAIALWIVWAPGAAMLPRARGPGLADPISRFAFQLGLGLALWPLLLLWSSTMGFAWSTSSARVALGLFTSIAIWQVVRSRSQERSRPLRRLRVEWVVFGIVVVLTVWTRFEQIRGLAFPPWVDPVHHAMVVRLLLEGGTLPATYDPFIPGAPFYYHWGYHAHVAFVCWISGATEPLALPSMQLLHGQFLNALTPLTVYAAARVLLPGRWAGVTAAALASLVSLYPAYYLSWGRYTHLAGAVLLPLVIGAVWIAWRRPDVHRMLILALLAAGLLLIHVRVAFFAVVFAIVLGVALTVLRRWRALGAWGVAGALALLLTAPWLVTLARHEPVRHIVMPSKSPAPEAWTSPAGIPDDILHAPRNAELFSLATGGLSGIVGGLSISGVARGASLAWWLILLAALVKTRRDHRFTRATTKAISLVGIWSLMTFVLTVAGGRVASVPQIASPSSVVITAFLPLALIGAALVCWAGRAPRSIRLRGIAMAILIVVISIAGAAGMREVVNPLTVLGTAKDLEAIRAISEKIPSDNVFAISPRRWIAGAWVGTDGGYWIGVLTGNRSIPPPSLYRWAATGDEVERIHAVVDTLASGGPPHPSALSGAGVTHFFVGEKSTPEFRAAISRLETTLILQTGEVRVLRWVAAGENAPRSPVVTEAAGK